MRILALLFLLPGLAPAAEIDWANPPMQCLDQMPANSPVEREILNTIRAVAQKYRMPENVLYGALKQESDLSIIHLYEDYGNYSCGIAQFGIGVWCEYMNSLQPKMRPKGWPDNFKCDTISSATVAPYFRKAAKLSGLHEDIPPQYFEPLFRAPPKNDTQKVVRSFIRNCSNFHYAIPAMAFIIRGNYDHFVPASFKRRERYKAGEGPAACPSYHSPYYPYHTGWLLADGIYNMGESLVDLIYDKDPSIDRKTNFSPTDLTQTIAHAGKLDPKTGHFRFKPCDPGDESGSTDWFHICISQHHITNVVAASFQDDVDLNAPIEIECAKYAPTNDPHKISSYPAELFE